MLNYSYAPRSSHLEIGWRETPRACDRQNRFSASSRLAVDLVYYEFYEILRYSLMFISLSVCHSQVLSMGTQLRVHKILSSSIQASIVRSGSCI